MDKVKAVIDYAKSFIGTPYRWAGSNPMSGWDCSGFIQEVLASVGKDPIGDQTSQGLYNYYSEKYHLVEPRSGSLAFYGEGTDRIRHVALCINRMQIIEAAGGGSKTLTLEDAKTHDAFVRIRPLMYRSDYIQSLFTFF